MRLIKILPSVLILLSGLLLSSGFSENREELYVKILKPESNLDAELLTRVSIDHRSSQELYAYLNASTKALLDQAGIQYEVQTHPGKATPRTQVKMGSTGPPWDQYPTYQEYLDLMQALEDSFPNLCQRIDIGNSVNGKKLLFLKISDNVTVDEAEPEFLYSSTMHGDETAGYVFLLRLAYELLHDYGADPLAKKLVDSLEIFINPLANPDGIYATSDTSIWGATRFNANGFDLNRNFPDPDNGFLPGGPRQIEALKMMNFMEGRNIHLSANIHSGAEVMNYPWDTWQKRHTDNDWFIYICREYADTAQANSPAGYMTYLNNGITNGWDWYEIAGGRQDYATYFLRGREVTIELSNTKVLPSSQLDSYYNYNRASMLNFMEQALFGLQGSVTDSITGSPLYAKIEIPGIDKDQSSVFSDSVYGFYARYLDSGNYTLEFSALGYETKVVQGVQLDLNKKNILDVQLSPAIVGLISETIEEPKIWPNPSTGRINIAFQENMKDQILEMHIYSNTGKVEIIRKGQTSDLSMLDLDLKPGIYFVKLSCLGVQWTRKLVISP